MTLYQIKEQMATLQAEMTTVSESINARAADPKVAVTDLKKDKERLDDLNARYLMLKDSHDKKENEDREKLQAQAQPDNADPKTAKAQARGEFYRAVLSGRDPAPIIRNAYQHLGAIPAGDADLGGGEHLLPTTMGNEIVSEPFDDNPMRTIITVSNITGLELPRIDYTVDDDFITDKETATELKLKGNTIVFRRNKVKIKAQVSDTVMRGTPLALQSYIDNALRSGLAAKEKKVMFSSTATGTEADMSFYKAGITAVQGSNMLDAILEAYAVLGDTFKANAKVVMRSTDWVRMVRELSNNSAPLWGAKPEDIIGIPAVFVDSAVKPIVGDFRYAQLNYDIGTTYDTDKDVDTGVYKFVLTAWFDHQIKLKSAFRIAEVVANP